MDEATQVFRLLATDLDGTALDGPPGAGVPDANRRAVAEVRALGVPVVVVTGRSWRSAVGLAERLGADAVVCSNGAVVWDLDRGCIGRHHGLDREVALRIVAAVEEVAPEVAWSWEAHDAFGFEPAFDARVGAPRTGRWDGGAVGPARTTMPPSLVKLTGHLGPEDPDVLLQAIAVAADVAGQAATPTTAGVGWLEVGPGGVTKAVSLAEVAAEHGVDATEVVAIGDQLNDVPMLRWAGLGVAMAAAPAAVRAEADRVAHPDGFAATLGALVAAGAFGRGR